MFKTAFIRFAYSQWSLGSRGNLATGFPKCKRYLSAFSLVYYASVRAKRVTSELILDTAQQMLQMRGYNAFSYADISASIGITKASIHHHFRSKKLLTKQLVIRYRTAFKQRLDQIDDQSDPARKLKRYADLYLESLRDGNRMCLCGMLASDIATLPADVRREVTAFFSANEIWLAKIINEGRTAQSFAFEGSPALKARFILSTLQGAMLLARSHKNEKLFRNVTQQLLNTLKP